MDPHRLLIFIVAYQAEETVEAVVSRIPAELFSDPRLSPHVLIIDDASSDRTFERGRALHTEHGDLPLTVLRNPDNLGYGGNQKLGYRYAIDQGFDVVALVHGDGQYAPEELPRLVAPVLSGEAEAVFGSRMMEPGGALRGGMPLYKWVGNKILTRLQNRIVGTRLSEYHSGYRIYSVEALEKLPFEVNSDGFDFDTEIIIQLHLAGMRIRELPIPTFYGDEICHVQGVPYGLKILWSSLLSRIQRLGLFYDPRFDLERDNHQYRAKFDFLSSHSLALDQVRETDRVVLLGCGPAPLVQPFAERARSVTAVDQYVDDELRELCDRVVEGDLDTLDLSTLARRDEPVRVLALDIIEHLRSPEDFLARIRDQGAAADTELVLTTGNVAFLPVRLMLLFGLFNYGKSGILDRTHTRLFTFASMRRLLEQQGFEVLSMRGIPAPVPLALGRESRLAHGLLALNALLTRVGRGVFSYQIFCVARPRATAARLLEKAVLHSAERAELLEDEPAGTATSP